LVRTPAADTQAVPATQVDFSPVLPDREDRLTGLVDGADCHHTKRQNGEAYREQAEVLVVSCEPECDSAQNQPDRKLNGDPSVC
jgi:hypothetical protein